MTQTFIFRCPVTSLNVQGYSESKEEQPSGDGQRRYEGVHCVACGRLHVVNPQTGRLLSQETEDP